MSKALELIPENDVVAWGGSVSIKEIGLLDAVKRRNPVIDRELADTPEEKMELMRNSLLCDTFLMSSNAISKDGQLVNIDGNGNRVAAMIFGPKQVVMVVGMNKVEPDLQSAIQRVHAKAAPPNALRLGLKTPCALTGSCADCLSPDCICAHTIITRYNRIKGRIKVILIGENLGY